MSLTEKDLEAIGLLMKQQIEEVFEVRLEPFRHEVNKHFDHLYKQDERREQEYLVITEQLTRIENRLESVENKVDGHAQRIGVLEKKVA
jgi:hypothetical protein